MVLLPTIIFLHAVFSWAFSIDSVAEGFNSIEVTNVKRKGCWFHQSLRVRTLEVPFGVPRRRVAVWSSSGGDGADGSNNDFTKEKVDAIRFDREALEALLIRLNAAIAEETQPKAREDLWVIEGRIVAWLDNLDFVEKKADASFPSRVESITFQVASQELVHNFDTKRFAERVLDLFDWHTNTEIRDTYVAPYFPLVQSSGMGKTKLLWELRRSVDENRDDDDKFTGYSCKTIVCTDVPPTSDRDPIFSAFLKAPKFVADDQARIDICDTLNQILATCEEDKVILLFDETQHLLSLDGFPFRCVLCWLRLRNRKKQVVAVFSGTTSRLTNFYAEPPKSKSSRDANEKYFTKGTTLYAPFYDICTIGAFAPISSRAKAAANDKYLTEYERAVPHGRPLFALMQKDNGLTEPKLCNILDRMLLGSSSDQLANNLNACVSVLGTRLQIGQTSSFLASDLVARGYAMLTNYVFNVDGNGYKGLGLDNVASICFPTDPVCARLAMGMMDEDWSVSDKQTTFQGKSKKFWIRMMGQALTTGLCNPYQGDMGELAGAAYLLFCGDLLRKEVDNRYMTFSVPLADFVERLLRPNQDGKPQKVSKSNEPRLYAKAHVNFIQVVRNYIRFDTPDISQQELLEDSYISGCAYYRFPISDYYYNIVATIRLTRFDGSFHYVPLLVSVSTEDTTSSQLEKLQNMENVLEGANTIGMGIRLLFGRSTPRNSHPEQLLTSTDVDLLLRGVSVSKVVTVPEDDPFGIVETLLGTSLRGPAMAEIYASHYYLRPMFLKEMDYKKLVRSSPNEEVEDYLEKLILTERNPDM
jgi:hypothetical protein